MIHVYIVVGLFYNNLCFLLNRVTDTLPPPPPPFPAMPLVLAFSDKQCWRWEVGGVLIDHVAAARKRSHQWCVSLTPSNTKTIGRMTCHCFLRPISRDLPSSSYITQWCDLLLFLTYHTSLLQFSRK